MTLSPAVLRRDAWSSLGTDQRADWLAGLRAPTPDADVGPILARVRSEGDRALLELTRELDGVALASLFVPEEELAEATERVAPAVREALGESLAAVRRYHADQRALLAADRRVRTRAGVTAWRRWVPIRRAGGYVPGGRARYPSSVIMLGVPAQLAGVDELLIATPPGPDGSVDPAVLYAASLVGVLRVLRVGGAQAIAALAYGTESVQRVDRIFGAGNAWVTAAKRLVAADCAIDLPAGPSECVVVADASADPDFVAADLLAQAEHGPDSLAVLVTDDAAFADAVEARLGPQAASLPTGERALATLREWGRIVLVAGMDAAVDVTDAIAPEHCSLQCRDAEELGGRIRDAGAVFIGPWSAVAAGDYATGTNHVLPTGGAARAYSGVGVESFGRWMEVQRVTSAGVRGLAPAVEAIAGVEGLPAHAASVALRAARAGGATAADDPVELLRRPGSVDAYPIEPSDEEMAASLGLPAERLRRYDLNTLGGGPLPGAVEGLRGYDAQHLTEYGDMAYRRLRAALGAKLDVPGERILPGAGADELIRLVATATLGEGDATVIPTPGFGMFFVESGLAGARIVSVPRRDPGERQSPAELREAAEREAARLVWLCTPNNPTGDRYPLDEIGELAEGLPALVLVDEVYLEFAEAATGDESNSGSAIRLQDAHPNVLVLRSLSKAYGAAAARVGYLVLPEGLAARFDALRLPLALAEPSEAVALGLLADEPAAVERRRMLVDEQRRLAATLNELGVRTLPSVTNFVAFQPRDASTLAKALAERGLLVREYDSGPMAGWLRANARAPGQTQELIDALKELLA